MNGEATYLLRQSFRYDYPSPVRDLRHRLMVVPRAVHGGQVRVDHAVSVGGAAATVSRGVDRFGNEVVDVRARRVADGIEFESWSLVRGSECGSVAAGGRRDWWRAPTALTATDGMLAGVARSFAGGAGGVGGGGALERAERICTWTNNALGYEWGVTTVRTTAAEAVAGGRGVCQDYAHVMLALCRAAGLGARYVSGHLVGEGGSHAWVEVVVDGGLAVAFDPTHDRRAGSGYVTVAVGRDYADVAPTSGRFRGDSPGRLTSSKTLTLVEDAAVLV